MSKSRREFIKDAAIVSAVVAAGSTGREKEAGAESNVTEAEEVRCPFFDQPMLCGGPDASGKYKCDSLY